MFIGSITKIGIVKKEICEKVEEEKLIQDTEAKVVKRISEMGMKIVPCKDADIVVAIGGDGTFLRGVREAKFGKNKVYVGINCGSLGFLQKIEVDALDIFFDFLKQPEGHVIVDIPLLQVNIEYESGKKQQEYAINEAIIVVNPRGTMQIRQYIDGYYLQDVRLNEVIIVSAIGSTGEYNSQGGVLIASPYGDVMGTKLGAPITNEHTTKFFREITSKTSGIEVLKAYGKRVICLRDGEEIDFPSESIKNVHVKYADLSLKSLGIAELTRIDQVRKKCLGLA